VESSEIATEDTVSEFASKLMFQKLFLDTNQDETTPPNLAPVNIAGDSPAPVGYPSLASAYKM
jgi:hypothetical protein